MVRLHLPQPQCTCLVFNKVRCQGSLNKVDYPRKWTPDRFKRTKRFWTFAEEGAGNKGVVVLTMNSQPRKCAYNCCMNKGIGRLCVFIAIVSTVISPFVEVWVWGVLQVPVRFCIFNKTPQRTSFRFMQPWALLQNIFITKKKEKSYFLREKFVQTATSSNVKKEPFVPQAGLWTTLNL